METIQAKADATRPAFAGKPAAIEWTEAVAADKAAAAGDGRCRKPVYERALAEVVDDVPGFAAANSAVLARVQDEWDAMITKTRTYPEPDTYLRWLRLATTATGKRCNFARS